MKTNMKIDRTVPAFKADVEVNCPLRTTGTDNRKFGCIVK
jgi:hypothetical protein